MDDALRPLGGEEARHALAILEIELREPEARVLLEPCEPRLFQRHVVVRVEVVEAHHRVAAREQPPCHVVPDEPGRAGHENRHVAILDRIPANPSGDGRQDKSPSAATEVLPQSPLSAHVNSEAPVLSADQPEHLKFAA